MRRVSAFIGSSVCALLAISVTPTVSLAAAPVCVWDTLASGCTVGLDSGTGGVTIEVVWAGTSSATVTVVDESTGLTVTTNCAGSVDVCPVPATPGDVYKITTSTPTTGLAVGIPDQVSGSYACVWTDATGCSYLAGLTPTATVVTTAPAINVLDDYTKLSIPATCTLLAAGGIGSTCTFAPPAGDRLLVTPAVGGGLGVVV